MGLLAFNATLWMQVEYRFEQGIGLNYLLYFTTEYIFSVGSIKFVEMIFHLHFS